MCQVNELILFNTNGNSRKKNKKWPLIQISIFFMNKMRAWYWNNNNLSFQYQIGPLPYKRNKKVNINQAKSIQWNFEKI